jgi:hypothetical protein
MIRGRHRGLPYALDRAITLPSDRTIGNNDTEVGMEETLSYGKYSDRSN